ncbi:MAG: zinc-ribbon domain-containing protein [Methanomassiliicoccales archaeon]|nr:MAG: zinc-ribbon domain-containing protein [Methanomassiliicoccales archaeon]
MTCTTERVISVVVVPQNRGQGGNSIPFCSSCGKSNPSDAKYCMECGKNLTSPSPLSTFSSTTSKKARYEKCPKCYGSGDGRRGGRCNVCWGEGWVSTMYGWEKCPKCNGNGCSLCHGRGYVW